MNNVISNDDFIAVLQETFNRGSDFSFNPTGNSMKPMLNGTTDTVILQKPCNIKKRDVILCLRRSDNTLVLHRVIRTFDDRLIISGDNQYFFDKDILFTDVLAVVKSFTHNGKRISVNSFFYRLYVYIILIQKYIRVFFSKIYHKIIK